MKLLKTTILTFSILLSVSAFSQEKTDKINQNKKEHVERMSRELNLTAEQEKHSKEIFKQKQEKMKPVMKEMKALRNKKAEINREADKAFVEILTPEQLKIYQAKKGEYKKRGKDKKNQAQQKKARSIQD